jgi:MATE family multidrug resistance protein
MRSEVSATIRLAAPIALANIGNQLLGLVDTAVVGRLGEMQLGAVGLGNSVYFAVAVVGLGLMLGLDPLVAQAVGAGERLRARSTLWQGIWIAALLTLPLAAVITGVVLVLAPLGIEAETAAETASYAFARLPGLPFFLVMVGTRSFLQAHSITIPIVIGVVVANVVNLPLSILLVFGDASLGIPQMGAAGAAWTSTVCTVLQCGIVLGAVRLLQKPPGEVSRRPSREVIARALRLGAPVGLALLAEVGLFALVGVLIGLLGTRPLAAHNVAIQLIATTFQVPLAIGAAASVRVGHAVGRNDAEGTRRAGLAALFVCVVFMGGTSLLFVLLPRPLAALITDETPVIAAAVPLILVAAAFQLGDGVQAVAAGALRGAGDTRFAMVANLLGHYGVGLPVGVLLAWGAGWGATGLWWALTAGLSTVAVALALRFLAISRRTVARV